MRRFLWEMAEAHTVSEHDGNALRGTNRTPRSRSRSELRDGESEFSINKVRAASRTLRTVSIPRCRYASSPRGRSARSSMPAGRDAHDHRGGGGRQVPGPAERAERKMESTRQNLARVKDILDEVRRQIGTLERQVGKAERYKASGRTEGARPSRCLRKRLAMTLSFDSARERWRHRSRASLCAYRPGADGRRPRRGAVTLAERNGCCPTCGTSTACGRGGGASRGGVGRASRTGEQLRRMVLERRWRSLPRIGDRGARRADRGGGRRSRRSREGISLAGPVGRRKTPVGAAREEHRLARKRSNGPSPT